jgi:hypothetical protein
MDMFTVGIGGNFVIVNAINDAGELSAVPLFPSGHNPRLSQTVATLWLQNGSEYRRLPSHLRSVGPRMLWTIFAILLVLWLLRLVSSHTLGGLIHLVLGLALVMPFENKSMKFKENM